MCFLIASIHFGSNCARHMPKRVGFKVYYHMNKLSVRYTKYDLSVVVRLVLVVMVDGKGQYIVQSFGAGNISTKKYSHMCYFNKLSSKL